MNQIVIIGNLTKDPVLRSTPSGVSVCDFTVAVNRRGKDETDYFRVTVWRQLAEICAKYLAKGRKVCVVGAVSARTYQANDGQTRVSLEVAADDVEFLSPRDAQEMEQEQTYQQQERKAIQQEHGFIPVVAEDLPF